MGLGSHYSSASRYYFNLFVPGALASLTWRSRPKGGSHFRVVWVLSRQRARRNGSKQSVIEVGSIVKNLIPGESVVITKIQQLGSSISLSYTGVNTKKSSSKVIKTAQLDKLEILTEEGKFNFKGDPEKFVLFAEAERINSAYQFDPLFAINCSVVDPLPHQVEAVYKYLLPQPSIRFLLADDTGAGKTIMTGLLLKELLMRKRVERVLIVTPGGLTKQWQEDEMGVKFNIPFVLANRAAFNSEPTIFQDHDRIVASIDFICKEDVMKVLASTSWDMIIFDEAHKLSAYEYGTKRYLSHRYEAALTLSKQCEHILLLTATPHRGRADTFKCLMQLLDEDIFATPDLAASRIQEIGQSGINKYFIRRLKEDMKDWQGRPLYKERYTKTVAYQLTPEEKKLYDAVTEYLTVRKAEASESKNIHVSLALQVMQRRLVSSIYAIRNTLLKRYTALQGLADLVAQNPNIWKQRQKLEDFDLDSMDDYDELEDDERDALDNIMADPKKLKLFTTAKTAVEIQQEAKQVKALYNMADTLYVQNQEEKKFQELKQLLNSEGVINGEKLVIFTEHKDTLIYLTERLSNSGYKVATIHGGKNVDERREAQNAFMRDEAQILIATDAAGEGINLQFCRLLINWDIPWNPNRLEQRMGRIHRYGQQSDVMVFNMVAGNTREGKVLSKLLEKMDVIRESLGDDRVYDVIQDVLKDVSLDDIISSVFDGRASELDRFISQDDDTMRNLFREKIKDQKNAIAHSIVDFADAHRLKEDSDEKRLQPIYVRMFFERAFKHLGGKYKELGDGIFQMTTVPEIISKKLKERYKINVSNVSQLLLCFDKHKFLDYQNANALSGKAHYINPGNPLFDALVDVVRESFREEMLKGTVLVSPEDNESYLAFYIKNQITDNSPSKAEDNVANELLSLVYQTSDGKFHITSPAKFLDLVPPSQFAKDVETPAVQDEEHVIQWAFEHITEPLLEETETRVQDDNNKRREYLETAFEQVILDLSLQINELQGKAFLSDSEKVQNQLASKTNRIEELKLRKVARLNELDQMVELSPKKPEVLGCAYVVPLSQMEYEKHFGMHRDDEVESIAMKVAMDYERECGGFPVDVSKDNVGYDIRTTDKEGNKRYVEVKGRAGTDGVMLSENEVNRLEQLGEKAWLYIVTNCKTKPELHTFWNPIARMNFQKLIKGVQFYLPEEEWKAKVK